MPNEAFLASGMPSDATASPMPKMSKCGIADAKNIKKAKSNIISDNEDRLK